MTTVQFYCDAAVRKLLEKSLTVFKCRLKTCNDGDDVTCAGSLFQTQAAKTGDARSPTVQMRVGEMTSASDDDEQSRCLDICQRNSKMGFLSYGSVHPR